MWGFGWRHGWRGGAGKRPWRWFTRGDYEYIGPCRCGFGPHAFWMERSTGRAFRGFPGPSGGPWPVRPTVEDLRSELKWLKEEKEELERRISELEAQIQKAAEEK